MSFSKESQLKAVTKIVRVILCVVCSIVFVTVSRAENGATRFFPGSSFANSYETPTLLGQQNLSNLFSLTVPSSRRLLFDRRSNDTSSQFRTWLRGFGNWTTIAGKGNEGESTAIGYGFTIGADRQIGRNILFGAGFGGTWVSAKENVHDHSTDVSAIFGLLYTRIRLQRLYFDLEGSFGSDENKIKLLGTDVGRYTVIQGAYGVEIGTWWESGLAKVEPYIGVRQVFFDDRSVSNGVKTTSILGLRYSWKTVSRLATVTPRVYAGWLHEWGDQDLFNAATFVDSPTVYRIGNAQMKEDRFFVGGGFTSRFGSSLDLYFRYTAEISSDYSAHTLLLGTNWNF